MCTLQKRGNIFILTLTGDGEHRFSPSLIESIRCALRRARSECTGPSVLITTAEGKYFSNGFDANWAGNDQGRKQMMSSGHRDLISDLIAFPMPTIAAVTGHALTAGYAFVLSHDYILMRKDRGFLYMNELAIGFKIPVWFGVLMKSKIGSPATRREVVMEAKRMTAEMAVERGIVDSCHQSAEETVTAAVKLAEETLARKWNGLVYSQNRMAVLDDVLSSLKSHRDSLGDYGASTTITTASRL